MSSSSSVGSAGYVSTPSSSSSSSSKRRRTQYESPLAGRVTVETETSYETPPVTKFTVCPGTTLRPSKFTLPEEEKFPNPQKTYSSTTLPQHFEPNGINTVFSLGTTYVENGKTHYLCQQKSTKDCGVAALLMFLTDISSSRNTPITVNKTFRQWASNCTVTNADKIEEIAQKGAGVQLETKEISCTNPLESLRTLITETRLPVMSAIDHPFLDGHWILVDHVGAEETLIRDPNTGKAYSIPNKTMKSYYEDEDEQGFQQSALICPLT